ncbi:MAG TPA: PP2C family protein-serine/threonine phosphatase [Tepidisphaeraceae bacterium]
MFAVHGLLLLAVLASAYLSVRAQYEALRDSQLEEARTDQQLTTRVGAFALQTQFQLLISGLTALDRDEALSPTVPTNWLNALALVDTRSGQWQTVRQGDAASITKIIREAEWVTRVTSPTAAVLPSDAGIAVAVPLRDGRHVAVALLSPAQITQDMQSFTQRAGTASTPSSVASHAILTADDGRVLASSTPARAGVWLQASLDPAVARQFNTMLASGNAGSELISAGGTTVLSVQSFAVLPGIRWHVVAVRPDVSAALSEKLRPLFWQLLSQSALMLAAVAIVLVSTTVSLTRGRRRIERLRTEMLNRDLQKARRIQLNWLPAPQFDGEYVRIAAENKPALHISGDFYNWFELPRGEDDPTHKTVIVIGDVSGHGLPAAFLMATTQLLVRNLMPRVRDPGACLGEINRQLCTLVYNGQFVTMMILVIDHDNAGLEIASAGHHAPLLKRDGVAESLPIDPQLVVGVDETVEYQTQRFRTRPGDAFLLFTDGAIEMTDPNGEQFRLDRLAQAFAAANGTPCETVAAINRTLDAFRGEADPEDDLTLMAAQITTAGIDAPVAGNPSLATSN